MIGSYTLYPGRTIEVTGIKPNERGEYVVHHRLREDHRHRGKSLLHTRGHECYFVADRTRIYMSDLRKETVS